MVTAVRCDSNIIIVCFGGVVKCSNIIQIRETIIILCETEIEDDAITCMSYELMN